MKSLPSTYRGVLFRSRLEARWAALFDSQSIQWVYEPEGFETPSGNYLPDFFLPVLECYVEVKPGPGMIDETAIRSVSEQTGREFLILDSPVVECRAFPLLRQLHDSKTNVLAWHWTDMSWCASRTYLGTRPRDGRHRFYVCVNPSDGSLTSSGTCPCCEKQHPSWEDECFVNSRNLRFNNGVAT